MLNLLQVQEGKKVTDQVSSQGLVVVFHGYGADRENLYDVAQMLSSHNPTLRFIVPNGIQKFEGGGPGYQWFSLREYTQKAMQNGLASVGPKISKWIKDRLAELNLTQDHLYLAGFSQGAMLSLYLAASGLLSPKKIVAFSGVFIPPRNIDQSEKKTEILAFHGDRDHVLPINMTEESYKLLPNYGLKNLRYISERGVEHYITQDAIIAAAKFIGT